MVYYKVGNLNALMYTMLIVFLYDADMESVLKTYTITALFFVVLIAVLSSIGVIPNLQFVQSRSAGVVVRNSFGFIYPTDFASHCFYLYTAFSIFRKRFIILRTFLGLGLSYFHSLLRRSSERGIYAIMSLISFILYPKE